MKLDDKRRPLADIARMLQERPGKWVKIARGDQGRMNSRAGAWRRRKPGPFAGPGLYEFRTQVTKRQRRPWVEVHILGRFTPSA